MECFEERGEWWLPERPDDRVPGTLRFSPDTGATLELIGALRSWRERGRPLAEGQGVAFGEEDLERSGTYPRVFGEAGSSAFTLEDCFQTNLSGMLGGAEVETVYANQVLKGAWFDEDLDATRVKFDLRSLRYWVGQTGLRETLRFAQGGDELPEDEPWVTIAAHPLAAKTTKIADETTIELAHSLTKKGDRVALSSIEQDFYFDLSTPGKRPLRDFIDLASDLQDLVSIGIDQTASFESMTFFHPDCVQKTGDRDHPVPIEYFVQWADRDDRSAKEAVLHHDMLFSCSDIEDMTGIGAWLSAAGRHRTALGRVMATRYSPGRYPSDRLVSRTAALEAFDRATNTNGTFRTRMKRCASFAGAPFGELVGDVEQWSIVLKHQRDDAAHHLDRRVGGSDQYFMGESAYWLFVLCMMREASFPESVLDRVAGLSAFQFAQRRLRAVLSKS